MSAVWAIDLPDSQKIVLLALADNANDEGVCWPSMATIAKKCSKGTRTVQGVIKQLCDGGHLTRKEVVGKGCYYTVHPRSDCPPQTSHPRKEVHPPPQPLRTTPAAAADKPSKNHHEPSITAKAVRRVDDFPCPDGVDQIDWNALKANRKAKRAALSEGAYRQIIKKLDGWQQAGWRPGPIVAYAAERGWTTVFETDEMKGQNNGNRKNGTDGAMRALDRQLGLDGATGTAGRRDAQEGERCSLLPPPS